MQVGHGLAAAAEGVGIHSVSFFLLLVLPGAYVTLNADNLAVLGPLRALNVSSPRLLSRLEAVQNPRLRGPHSSLPIEGVKICDWLAAKPMQ